jgi:competence protein ComFC
MFKDFLGSLVNLIYPANCFVCKKHLGPEIPTPVCANCLDKIEKNLPPFCAKCGGNLKEAEVQSGICSACRSRDYGFKRAWSATIYRGAMEELIHLFKYKNKSQLARPLSKMMVDFIKNYNLALKGFDILVAVPLHSSKLREREYNQAQLLTEHISNYLNIPCSEGNLQRKRPTQPQSNLTGPERWNNVIDAFGVKNPEEFKDKRALIIDDLLTTGATCSEIAKTLKDSGADSVYALTLSIAR